VTEGGHPHTTAQTRKPALKASSCSSIVSQTVATHALKMRMTVVHMVCCVIIFAPAFVNSSGDAGRAALHRKAPYAGKPALRGAHVGNMLLPQRSHAAQAENRRQFLHLHQARRMMHGNAALVAGMSHSIAATAGTASPHQQHGQPTRYVKTSRCNQAL
jgi:hypothetical protein